MINKFERPTEPSPIPVNDLSLVQVDTFRNSRNVNYDIFELKPQDKMPEIVAEWLRYRSLTDHSVKAANEGDAVRFMDVETICEKFLNDSGGRDLFLAINSDTQSLDGVSWIHPVQYNYSDFLIADSALSYFSKIQKQKEEKGLKIDPVKTEELATLATREYGKAARTNLAVHLGVFAVNKYLVDNPEFKAIVARFGTSDGMILELNDNNESNGNDGTKLFSAIEKGAGYVIMMACKEDNTLKNNPFAV